MTGRPRVLFDTEVDPDRAPAFSSAPLELKLIEALPDMCSEHGLPAVERRPFVVNSQGLPGSEMPSIGVFFRSIKPPWRPQQNYGIQARLRFECPACEYCLSEAGKFRRIALLALSAIVATVVAIVVAVVFGVEQLAVPLALAVVPGCLPVAAVVGIVAWTRSDYFADVWLTDTTEQLIVSAHPDFVTVVDQRRTGTH
ncbi:hypothetical protein [Nocardia carnea]|uniref:hypothetical protein n=1 Tax=Nocardia carnea TaxID=37328 RepID=UPI0024559EC0|nr:hypothetical protein [Nocardia carnea]